MVYMPSISYRCDECGNYFDLIRFELEKDEPDVLGLRQITVRTKVREIVSHICAGRVTHEPR